MSTALSCTRCGQFGESALRGTIDDDLPFSLCALCHRRYCSSDATAQSIFSIDLWQRAAVELLDPEGHA